MNPHKMNKIDVSQMSEEDQKAFKMFGRLPQKNLLSKMQKDRKYFDSGDYMMSKAGVQSAQAPGTAIPTPEGLPHAFSPLAGQNPISASPSTPTGGGSLPIPGSAPAGAGVGPNGVSSPIQSPSPTATSAGAGAPGSFSHAQSQAQPIPGHHHHASSGGSVDAERPGVHSPFSQSPGVGVGIRPAGEEGVAMGGHRRRPSMTESGSRTSPPAPLRDGANPSSSYPIHHPGHAHAQSFGSSPVKSSSLLARKMQVDENE